MLRTFLITLLLYATTLTAFAQTTDPSPQTQNAPVQTLSVSIWPAPTTAEKLPQSNLDLVTTGQPTRRQRCHVHEIEADSITCTTKHHRPDITYQREEIIALIAPPAFLNLLGIVGAAASSAQPSPHRSLFPLAGPSR